MFNRHINLWLTLGDSNYPIRGKFSDIEKYTDSLALSCVSFILGLADAFICGIISRVGEPCTPRKEESKQAVRDQGNFQNLNDSQMNGMIQHESIRKLFGILKNSQLNRMTVISPLKHFTGPGAFCPGATSGGAFCPGEPDPASCRMILLVKKIELSRILFQKLIKSQTGISILFNSFTRIHSK